MLMLPAFSSAGMNGFDSMIQEMQSKMTVNNFTMIA
jgi:hypothetical protein